MVVKAKVWFISIAVSFTLALGGWYVQSSRQLPPETTSNQPTKHISSPVITGYLQDAKSVSIEFDSLGESARYIVLPDVPATLDIDHLRQQSKEVGVINGKIVIPIDSEPNKGEYSIVIFLRNDFLELVRQSSDWSKHTFNFDRVGGYTILGRRSVETDHSGSTEIGPLIFKEIPIQANFLLANISPFEEINNAAGLLRKLWSQPIQQGPTSESYATFLEQNFEEKMRRVGAGEFAVMCQGFRDLFLHASAANHHFKVRPIEAYNYYPNIPNLITYGHSTAEIWVEALNRWVLFDPWLGIMVAHKGIPIGAKELNSLTQTDDLSVIPLLEKLPRMYRRDDGQIVHNSFRPTDVKINDFSCQDLGCSPGYIEYFKNYKVREFRVLQSSARIQ
jgi:hypothetical protein